MAGTALSNLALRDANSTFHAQATQKQVFDNEYSANSVLVTLSVALALYNSLEMVFLILSTFKKWKGLYFWSLTLCNCGVILYTFGIMLFYFELGPLWLSKVFCDCIGWILMIVCQSLVLYSRLGLIVGNQRILDAVKWMIIFGGVVVCTASSIAAFTRTYVGTVASHEYFYYIEQIQMIYFTCQELIISLLYVWKTLAFLASVLKAKTRAMIWQLLAINVVIISMDLGLVTLQFLHYQLYQETLKAFFYSVKLKLELNTLSKLVDLVPNNDTSRSMTVDAIDADGIVGRAQAELRQEMSQPGALTSWHGGDEKRVVETRESSTGSGPGPNERSSSTRPLNTHTDHGIVGTSSLQRLSLSGPDRLTHRSITGSGT